MKSGEQEPAGNESQQGQDGPSTLEAARAEAARVMVQAELQAAALRSQAAGIRFEARAEKPDTPAGQQTTDPRPASVLDLALGRLNEIDTHISTAEDELLSFLTEQMRNSRVQRVEAGPATATTASLPIIDDSAGGAAAKSGDDGAELELLPVKHDALRSRWAQPALLLLLGLLTVGGSMVLLAGL